MDNQDGSQSSNINRVPPNDQEAELAVISAMLFDREAVAGVCDLLKPDDFYRPDYRAVYESMEELFKESLPVDLITLKNKLEMKGLFEKIGGMEALANIAGYASTSANALHYARIIGDKSILRRLIKASGDIMAAGFEASLGVGVILDNAEKAIFDIGKKRSSSEFTHIHETVIKSIDLMEEASRNGSHVTGVPTGFIGLDMKTAGLHPSDLILVAARPSMGKTALGLNILQYAAIRQNVTTAMFSLEMSKEQLVNRLICSESMVEANKIRTGQLDKDDWLKIAEGVGRLSDAPIYLDDTPGITVAEVRAKCRQLKMKHGLGLIIIDYLQLMSGSGQRNESRQQEISEISRSLKAVAREMEAPLVALAQLSRAPEQRSEHRPILSDLRESGAIEQDADLVCFIYRDEYYNPETEKKNIAEIIIAKQRNGETGTVELGYLGNYVKFTNLEKVFS